MFKKELKKSEIIIGVIGIIVIIALIAFLTKYITSRKQAVYVATDESDTAALNVQTSNSSNDDVWKINNDTKVENTVTENTINNTTENATVENKQTDNNTEVSNQTNNTTENTTNNTSENQSVENTTNNTQANSNTTETKTANKSNASEHAGVIWLTFDDGPSANITPKILDILKKENIKATFFVINYSNSNEYLIKRAVEEGHTIGIHGYSHEYSKIYKSKETFMNNVYTLQDRIEKSTGVKTMYTRFPGGSSNTVSRKYCKGIMTALTKEMLAKGFKYYDWNISSGDAGGAKTAKDVYKNVTNNLSKKRGNMVLMHDFGGNKKGLEALPDIIAYGKKNGYKFAKIDDNTPMYAQHVNN